MDKEDEQKSGRQQPEGERKFSQQQYALLKRCSEMKKMTEWNQWRKKHPKEEIRLQEADLSGAYLENADLQYAHLEKANLKNARLEKANLKNAHLDNAYLVTAHLENANLDDAHLENAKLSGTHLEKAYLGNAHLENANLEHAHLANSSLNKACMERANLAYASLHGADFSGTDLKKACGCYSHMKGTKLSGTDLKGACFRWAIVDGSTLFMECEIDCCTDFYGVGLGAMRIGSETKQLLEYNIRRMNWEEWYEKHPKMKWLVKPFWLMSDYGLSTGRIIITFFALAFVFAAIYYVCCMLNPPGIVSSVFEGKEGLVPVWLVPLRTIYFSIVTMTTLGFGDMHANCQSFLGHLLLTVQVILGYVLLGAMVTRFAVLFTAGGPAGKFAPTKTKETAEGEKEKA